MRISSKNKQYTKLEIGASQLSFKPKIKITEEYLSQKTTPINIKSQEELRLYRQSSKVYYEPNLLKSKQQYFSLEINYFASSNKVIDLLGIFPKEAINIDTTIIKKADQLIKNLYSISQSNNWWWQDPLVNISIDDEIVLEWWNQAKKITIYVGADMIEFIKVWGADMENEMEDGFISINNKDLKILWQWLANQL